MVDGAEHAVPPVPGLRPVPAAPDFRVLFEQLPTSYVVLDPDLVIVAVSDAYLRDTMTRRDDLIGRDIFYMFPENPDDPNASARAIILESFDRVRRTRQPDTLEVFRYDIPRPESDRAEYEVRYWSVTNVPVLQPDGSFGYIINRVQDVTGFVQLKGATPAAYPAGPTEGQGADLVARSQELAAANRVLRRMAVSFERQVAGAPDATIVVDRSGVIQMVNERALELFGYGRPDLVGSPVEILVPESLREVHVRHRTAYAADPRMRKMGAGLDLAGRRRDGSQFPVDVSLYCAEVADGLVVASVRDLTEQRQQEQATSRLAAIVECADDAIYTISDSEVISSWNHGAERLYGYTEKEIIGQPVTALIPPGIAPEAVAHLHEIGSSGQMMHRETKRIRKDGTVFDVALTASPVRDTQGRITGIATIARDITARKQAEQQQRRAETEIRTLNAELERRVEQRTAELARANEDLEAFTYSVSHDLRAPLRAMSGFSEALVQEYGDRLDQTGRGYAGRIQAATERMAALIDDLLLLSRMSRAELKVRPVDLGAEVSAVAADLRSREPGRRVRFRIQDGVVVMADQVLIHTVVQNLIENAWKFTAKTDGAAIEFAAEPAGEAGLCCSVRDNGAGFDPAFAGKLFQPFQRLHPAREYPGTGIGLASVARIIRRHGGRTWAEGAVGLGATFYFTLPARPTTLPARPATAPARVTPGAEGALWLARRGRSRCASSSSRTIRTTRSSPSAC